MASNVNKKHLTLLDIHQALAVGSIQEEKKEHEEKAAAANVNSKASGATKTLQAVTRGEDTSAFHEALHEYSIFSRPTSANELAALAHLVTKLFFLCGSSADTWKVFCLTACLRRYHQKAPEARHVASSSSDGDRNTASTGDGERLIYYSTILTLQQCWMTHKKMHDDLTTDKDSSQYAYEAMSIMIHLTARIGGSRDLCAIIEHLTMANLLRGGYFTCDNQTEEDPPENFAYKLVPAVQECAIRGHPDALLELALQSTARQLDDDLRIVEAKNEDDEEENLLSTIHVMLPHSGRGSNTKNGWHRKLVNALAEVLIWQRTEAANADPRFAKALDKLKLLPASAINQVHTLILQLQTTVRKKRQLLNGHARGQGFLLTSSYLLDKNALTLRQVRRAKAGDLKMLERLARKHRHVRTLQLIGKRHLDPSKATAITSIPELANDWVDTEKSYGDDDEIAPLELALQANTVKATLDKLRCSSERTAWVTCLGRDRDNLVCAILVAAGLDKSRLFLGGEEHDVSDSEKCIVLLNQVILHDKFGTSATLSASELLAQKVGPSEDVLVVSNRDLELDEAVLKDVQKRDITLRAHATKKVEKVGKVSLSLSTTIYDRIKAGQFLSLGVMLDCTGSMGGEIQGCKKGAIELISNFRDLAPVKSFNFMGYWDPVNVRSDPQPKSTGYLEANKKNMSDLQTFVNAKLVCQGGGDEPEDIPKALEDFLKDAKAVGLSADEGVHFLFFIADAGYRRNETARVRTALEALRKLGIVLVMCRVRGGSNLQTFVSQTAESFQSVGQYVELNDVGQLASIAASVTESIRASLFGSNVKSVTASVGSAMDSLCQLVHFQKDHKSLKETEDLTMMSDEDEAMTEVTEREPKVFAKTQELTLTSRDRLYLQLSRLPPLCHESVNAGFGGRTLQELSAALVADRIRADKIHLSEVRKAGYPEDIVGLVANLVGGSGVKRVEA